MKKARGGNEVKDLAAKIVWQSDDGRSYLYHGDGLEVMASMPANGVDCIWTDPPYLSVE